MAEQLKPLADEVFRHVPRRLPIAQMVADLAGDDIPKSVGLARREALKWITRRSGKLPAAAWEGEDFDNPVPGVSASGVRCLGGDFDFWASRLDYSDKEVAGRTWTTELLVAHQQELGIARFGVRLTMSTREPFADFVPTVPGVVRQVVDVVGLKRNNRPVETSFREITDELGVDELVELINDKQRRRPVIAISLPEGEVDPDKAVINAKKLAIRTTGLAHICVLSGPATYSLTDQIGKKFSVFNGAVRTYRPDCDLYDGSPYDHPLAMPDAIRKWQGGGRNNFVGQLIRSSASESLRRIDSEKDLPGFSTIKNVALTLRRRQLRAEQKRSATPATADPDLVELAEREIEELKRKADERQSLAHNEKLRVRQIEEERNILRSQAWGLRERVKKLEEDLASSSGKNVDDKINIPDSLAEMKDWADRNLPGLVLVTPRAAKAAREGQYKDVALVYRTMLALGREYRDMRLHGGKDNFEKKCRELGVECTKTFAGRGAGKFRDEYFIPYKDRKVKLELHLKRGNDRDQRNCLRVYFFWDDEDKIVVIGSLPGHLRTRAS